MGGGKKRGEQNKTNEPAQMHLGGYGRGWMCVWGGGLQQLCNLPI